MTVCHSNIIKCSWWYLTQRWRCTSCSDRSATPPHPCRTVALSPGGCQTAVALDLCRPSVKSPSHPQKRRTWTSPGSATGSAGAQQAALRGRNPSTVTGQRFQTETLNFWSRSSSRTHNDFPYHQASLQQATQHQLSNTDLEK